MMLVNGVASYPPQGSLYFQYFAPVVPFLLWGTVAGWTRLRRGSTNGLAVVATISMFVLLGPYFYLGYGAPDRFASNLARSGDRREFSEVLEVIPGTSSVSATDFLVPHLSKRREIYPFPAPLLCLDSLIFHVDHTSFPAYVAIEWSEAIRGRDWRVFLAASGYEEVASTRDMAVWNLTNRPPVSVPCPSKDEVRRSVDSGHPDWSGM